MLLGLYFLIVIALPLALGSYVVYNGLPRSRRCPMCADDTLRLESRAHHAASRVIGRTLHLRWCVSCGWQGTARMGPLRPHFSARSAGDGAAGADRVDLRTLDVDGDPWRVMIECWAENGRWVARLVFIAPGGRVCADQRSLEGSTVLEVISQAFSLPEQTLAGRLRRSIR